MARRSGAPRTSPDTERKLEALKRRVRLMEQSAAQYDAGDQDQALRLAVDLRALLHSGNGASLLAQLGAQRRISFLDTERHPPSGVMVLGPPAFLGLRPFRRSDGSSGWEIAAPLGGMSRNFPMIGFGTWWSVNTPVSLFQEKHTRSWVVLEMANSEGAHDDPTLDERYHELKNLQGGGYVTASGGINEFINPQPAEGNIVHASIRQITYEVLESLNRQMTLIESSARLAHLPKRN